MKGYITASVILGAAAVFSSLIISGNISFKDEHIIQLSGGAIKLGDVYKENKLISAKIIFPDNQGEQILVVDGNPENFKEDFQEKLNKVIKTLNASKKKDEEKVREGANKRGNSSRLTQSFHFFMFEPIFSPVNALNQPI